RFGRRRATRRTARSSCAHQRHPAFRRPTELRNYRRRSRFGRRLVGPRRSQGQQLLFFAAVAVFASELERSGTMRSLAFGILLLLAVPLSAQSKKASVARTADGHPDLQATWDFAQLTPFERPSEFADKATVTDEEAEEFAQRRIETSNKDKRDGGAAA